MLVVQSQMYLQQHPTDNQQPSTSQDQQEQQKKKPKMYLDIEKLLHLMKTYKTPDKLQLLKEASQANDTNHQDQLKDLIRSQQWNIIYRKAQDEYEFILTLQDDAQSYFNTFMQNVDDSRQKTMPYEDTVNFFTAWTTEQNIDLLTFTLEMYTIIRMYHPKKNTLYLQGASNAGKTYVLESKVPHKDKVGQYITSKDFMFQECLNKTIILVNELTLQNQTEAETYKKTF